MWKNYNYDGELPIWSLRYSVIIEYLNRMMTVSMWNGFLKSALKDMAL